MAGNFFGDRRRRAPTQNEDDFHDDITSVSGPRPKPIPQRKLVIVGDGACGKTALLMVQSGQPFPEKYFPTIFENFVSTVDLPGNKKVQLSLWDTAGQEDYDRLRPLSYTDTDVVILVFELVGWDSYNNIQEKWAPELRHFLPNVPIILVGTKKDLRDDMVYASDKSTAVIPPSFGHQLMTRIGACQYMETSAKNNEGVNELFKTAAKIATKQSRRRNNRNCLVM
ncbi:hypothetical protein SeMB42_g06958 [Synchytrium endobioticum]|uniref:Small monomeric GTPase n=1 Tax=Synchytrium endobioticum TaxID=286115 RepID=A0A507D8W4_9FUNG|nr:hypothetical protein SeMB42_g06958 [Synchytrium endobioticum]TPX47973.1 hypothetical protein SeLEV6574_g02334 [Synchytrium endobioticum]